MRIQSKLVILLIMLMAVICASLAAMRYQESRVLRLFFQKEVHDKQLSFDRTFAGMSNTMHMLVTDYSQWDGMDPFLRSLAFNRPDKNEITYLIDSYKMHAVWLYDAQGVLRYTASKDQETTGFHLGIPADSLARIFDDQEIAHFFSKTPGGIMEVYGAPVHPSHDAKSLSGYLFMGRMLNYTYMNELSRLTEGQITVLDASTSPEGKYDEKAGTFSFNRALKGWNGLALAYMQVQIRNDMIQNLNVKFHLGFFLIAILLCLVILVSCLCFFYWVNIPLSIISKSLMADDASYIAPLQGVSGEFGEIAHMISDFFDQKQELMQVIAARMTIEKDLLLSQQRFRIAAECASDLVYEREPESGAMEWFGLVDIRLGYAVREFPRTSQAWEESIHPEDRAYVQRQITKSLKSYEPFFAEYRIRRKDGEYLHWKDHGCMLFDAQGAPQKMIGVITDITDRRLMEDELKSLSLTDGLTGLYNRRGFMTLAEQQIRIANRKHESMILFFTDVDGLKQVNDTYGHFAGDELIMQSGRVLRECFRQSDIIARMGGDEFAVLAVAPQEESDAQLNIRLQTIIAEFNHTSTEPFRLSMSVGFVRYDAFNPCSIEDLIAQADQLMYVHKRERKAALIKNSAC